MTWTKGSYTIDMDKARLDLALVHGFLTRDSYWAQGISRTQVERAVQNSLCFGLYKGSAQVGFARVITDEVSFAYLCDVFVVPEERGTGLGTWLVEVATGHPELRGLRRWLLGTKDAHGLYAKFGFGPFVNPDRFMERFIADAYTRKSE